MRISLPPFPRWNEQSISMRHTSGHWMMIGPVPPPGPPGASRAAETPGLASLQPHPRDSSLTVVTVSDRTSTAVPAGTRTK